MTVLPFGDDVQATSDFLYKDIPDFVDVFQPSDLQVNTFYKYSSLAPTIFEFL